MQGKMYCWAKREYVARLLQVGASCKSTSLLETPEEAVRLAEVYGEKDYIVVEVNIFDRVLYPVETENGWVRRVDEDIPPDRIRIVELAR